jgi:hypothetical protein
LLLKHSRPPDWSTRKNGSIPHAKMRGQKNTNNATHES